MKALKSLLEKEARLVLKRPVLLFLILLLPVFFGIVFSSYSSAVPQDTPVGIVIDENLSQARVKEIMAIARTFSDPHLEDSLGSALVKLQREEYYVVIEIKHYRSFTDASYVVYYDDSMTPVASISENLLELLRVRLGGTEITEKPLNNHASLPQFFFPSVLLTLALIVGLELVPDLTIAERPVFPRLRAYSSLPLNFGIRIGIALVLMALQAALAELAYVTSGSSVGMTFPAFAVILITTTYLSLLGLGFVIALGFRSHAKTVLQLLAGFLVLFSGFFFPVGFFPSSLQAVAKILPTYYSGVLLRGTLYRDVSLEVYSDYLGIILVFTIAVLILDWVLYRRVREWTF